MTGQEPLPPLPEKSEREEELETLFESISSSVKSPSQSRPTERGELNPGVTEFTRLILDGKEAEEVCAVQGDRHAVVVGVIDPVRDGYWEWTLKVSTQVRMGNRLLVQGRTIYKTGSMSRGIEFDLQKTPAEVYDLTEGEPRLLPSISGPEDELDELDEEADYETTDEDIGVFRRLESVLQRQ